MLWRLYVTWALPVLTYGLADLSSCLSGAEWRALETGHLAAARLISGVARSTPRASVYKAANVYPLRTQMEWTRQVLWERRLRLPGTSGHQAALAGSVPQSPAYLSQRWASSHGFEAACRGRIPIVGPIPPWCLPLCRVTVAPRIPGFRKRDHSPDAARGIAQAALDALPAHDVMCFSDGSAQYGAVNGGAGFAVYRAGRLFHKASSPAGIFCSSTQAEAIAVGDGLEYLADPSNGLPDWRRCVFVTRLSAAVASPGQGAAAL